MEVTALAVRDWFDNRISDDIISSSFVFHTYQNNLNDIQNLETRVSWFS